MPKQPKQPKYEVSTTEIVEPSVLSIPTVEELNHLHKQASIMADEARLKATSAAQTAILIGCKLEILRENTPHGGWEKLFKGSERRLKSSNANHGCHLDFTPETARKYIAVAAQIQQQRLSPESAQALREVAQRQELCDADRQFLDSITPAETLRQLYLEMGIVKPTKREAIHLEAPPQVEPEKPKKKLSLVEQLALKKAEAREYWFGTSTEGRVNRGSIVSAFEAELHNPVSGRLHLLAPDDLVVMKDYMTQLLSQIDKHLSA